MRRLLGALCLALALPSVALAEPSTSVGYTAKDQDQYAKLAAFNGTWTCQDTPAGKKPDIITAKQAGNWYIWSESSDTPNTTYVTWSHSLQAYATWKVVYPASGPTSYPFKSSSSGNTITWTGQYPDPQTRKLKTFTAVCTKG